MPYQTPQPPHRGRASEKAAEEATAWLARLGDGRAETRTEFERWLAADPIHREAYAEAERLWRRLEGPARELGASGWHRASGASRRFAFGWRPAAALAASVALLAVALWWRDPGVMDRALADLSAPPGQARAAELADGSTLYLDGDSAVEVDMTRGARRVTLLRGRAWFDVAHDATRPFIVRAGEIETRVLGTAFAVERDGNLVRVTVERGRVAVRGSGGRATELGPGERAAVSGSVWTDGAIDAEAALAWRRGLIVFDRASLAQVVAELDRRTAGRVLLGSVALGELTLSGVFRADDPQAVLGALQSGLGLRVARLPGVATVIYR